MTAKRRRPHRGVVRKAEAIRIALGWPRGDVSVSRFGTSVYLRNGAICIRVSDHLTRAGDANIHANTWSDTAAVINAAMALELADEAKTMGFIYFTPRDFRAIIGA